MFDKNFEKKFNRATEAFTKAISDLDIIAQESMGYVDVLNEQVEELTHKIDKTLDTHNKVTKVTAKLKEIFGE